MQIEDIVCSSFVYAGSSRKDAILAAAVDPINKELVTQMVNYLDDKYLKPRSEVMKRSSVVNPSTSSRDTSADNFDGRSTGSGSNGKFDLDDDDVSLASMFGDDEMEFNDNGTSEPPEPEGEEPPANPSAEEPSANPSAEASQNLPTNLASITGSIQATLNADPETAGVRTTKLIGNEMWIYYKDDVNLNTVMESVIVAVPDSIAEFNRLARSHNAIVFTSRS